MKVVLINPLWARGRKLRGPVYNRLWPPVSLATAAAMMRNRDVEVSIIDANAEGIHGKELAERVTGADYAFITSSTLDKWVCPNTEIEPFLDAVRVIRSAAERTVITGVHGSVRPREMLQATGVYAVVLGEPEETMTELAMGGSRESTPGVAFFRDAEYVVTPDRPLLDISRLPVPAMDLLPLDRYRYEILGNRLMLLETTRGCPHRCRFCLRAMYGGRSYRKKAPERIREEIRSAVHDHAIRTIYFMDIEFTIDRALAHAVCDSIEDIGGDVRWCCQTRADTLDPELVKRMKEAGCRLVHFGVESGSDRVLKRIGKGEDTAQIMQGVRMVQDMGMETACFFMFGFPEETAEEMHETIAFAKRLAPTYASFHVLEPYPGTPMADELSHRISGDFFPISYTHPSIDLRAMQRKALMKFYLRPSYMFRRMSRGGWGMLARQIGILADYLR